MPDDLRPAEPAPALAADQRKRRHLGVLLIVVITLIWGVSWPFMKIGVEALHVWNFRVLTTCVAGVVMLAGLLLSGTSILVPRRIVGWLLLSSFINTTMWMVCSAIALELLPAGRSAIIAYTMPVWAVLFGAIFLNEKITLDRALGLVLGLAGLAVLMGDGLGALSAAPLGALVMTVGAIFWASGTVILKRIHWGIPVVTLASWQLFLGGLPIMAGAFFFDEGPIGAIDTLEAVALLYIFFVGVLVGNYVWLKLVSVMPASVASISTVLIPVIGVMSSQVVLGEPLTWREAAALALVVMSLLAVLGWLTRLIGQRAS